MSRRPFSKTDLSIIIGNTLDHFDTSLYGFLAPIMAPLFFPHHDPIVQLILAYSILATSIITRPTGAFLFGMIARHQGAARGLSLSLLGVALFTVLIGCLPTYESLGYWAPLSLLFVRMVRSIFAAGETTIAKLYILEGKADKSLYSAASYYETSSVGGIILASVAVTLITLTDQPQLYWRIPFLLGGLTGVAGLYLRRDIHRLSLPPVAENRSRIFIASIKMLWQERIGLLHIAAVTGLSYVTYAIPFIFMNSFIPHITSLSFSEMMKLNTFLLFFDMLAIPFLGRLVRYFPAQRVMLFAAGTLCLSVLPLFYALENSSFFYVSAVRMWIVILGLLYLCPLNIWLLTQFPQANKYLLAGIGGSLGASLLGRNATVIALLLWRYTGQPFAPAYYIMFVSLLAIWGLLRAQRK